ncbi:hypothetical protein [Enterococcus faecium]|uniref:hypothetical protein n=1 Tax=Enterococcus faecium TaxID=1352 RepID=UPI00338F9AE5
MKKFLFVCFMLLVFFVSGCSKDEIGQALVSDTGKWELKGEGYHSKTILTFYDDNQITWSEGSQSFGGSYEYDDSNKKLTVTIDNEMTRIFSDLELIDSNQIEMTDGEINVTLEKMIPE